MQRKKNYKSDLVKPLSKIMELSKHSLSDKSLDLVQKKLAEYFEGEKIQFTRTSGKYRSVLMVNIGSIEFKIHVKSKRKWVWPAVKGIKGNNDFIVFIDYSKKESFEDAEFYFVDSKEWKKILNERLSEIIKKKPNERIEIDGNTNTPIFIDQIKKTGKPYRGIDINVSLLHPYKDSWSKLGRTKLIE